MKKDAVFIDTVLSFYRKQGRHDLSWRKGITGYSVLVSEIMLQQTQVSRVKEKYMVWMKKYPTLKALRGATLQEVLIFWQGLGYQRRAKALYTIGKEYSRIPTQYLKLLEMPCVGQYTASAVMAFAYDKFSTPMLETNIRTALIEEYYQDRERVDDTELASTLARITEHEHVQKVGARTWYYALMDYGAHLKALHISHNSKSAHHTKQTPFKGSKRELRAKVLFAITHGVQLPKDEKVKTLLQELEEEGFIYKDKKVYIIKEK